MSIFPCMGVCTRPCSGRRAVAVLREASKPNHLSIHTGFDSLDGRARGRSAPPGCARASPHPPAGVPPPPYEILYEIRTVRRERVLGTCVIRIDQEWRSRTASRCTSERVPRRSSLADRRPHTGPRQHTCERVHLHPHPLTRDSFRRGERGVGVHSGRKTGDGPTDHGNPDRPENARHHREQRQICSGHGGSGTPTTAVV